MTNKTWDFFHLHLHQKVVIKSKRMRNIYTTLMSWENKDKCNSRIRVKVDVDKWHHHRKFLTKSKHKIMQIIFSLSKNVSLRFSLAFQPLPSWKSVIILFTLCVEQNPNESPCFIIIENEIKSNFLPFAKSSYYELSESDNIFHRLSTRHQQYQHHHRNFSLPFSMLHKSDIIIFHL